MYSEFFRHTQLQWPKCAVDKFQKRRGKTWPKAFKLTKVDEFKRFTPEVSYSIDITLKFR